MDMKVDGVRLKSWVCPELIPRAEAAGLFYGFVYPRAGAPWLFYGFS